MVKVTRRNKFGAKREVVDGINFHSKAEARRYSELRLLERSGEITNLELQPKFPCTVNGVLVCTYFADFRYFTRPTNTKRGEYIVEDVKSDHTRKEAQYRIKKKLTEALYPGLAIVEVGTASDRPTWTLRKREKAA